MTTNLYLAMTAAEFHASTVLPPNIAWMACHFSPYSTGISNLPEALPEGSLLILNDITPIHNHDPEVVAEQLQDCIRQHNCSAVLLDFQRYPCESSAVLAKKLVQALPCPVAVSEPFSENLDCPVFLPPCPPHRHVEEYLYRWKEREVWLEASLEGETILLTQAGAQYAPLSPGAAVDHGFCEERLHCHYRGEVHSSHALFTLWRTESDLEALCLEGEKLGVTRFVGLYQELIHKK